MSDRETGQAKKRARRSRAPSGSLFQARMSLAVLGALLANACTWNPSGAP
jgi:hypothetical protein